MAFGGRVVETFVVKDMSNVASTGGTAHLRPCHSHGLIDVKNKRLINSLVEGRPTAARIKFGFGFVKWRFTPCTQVLPFLIQLIILTYALPTPSSPPSRHIASG